MKHKRCDNQDDMKPPVKRPKKSLETHIEDAIIDHPGRLGFPQATAIRNYRIANEESGAVDLILFPKRGPFRVVLVEAKVATAADAGSKVVGQLLMFIAALLPLDWMESRYFESSLRIQA